MSRAVWIQFTHNMLVALYRGYVRVTGVFVNYSIWPACAVHASMALLLAFPAYGIAAAAKARKALPDN